MSLRPLSLATLVFCALACERGPAPTPPTTAGPQLSGLRPLALQDPGAEGAVDAQIKELQALVRRQPERHDAWILLGRAWIQKARQVADPGYYTNAEACASVALELKPDHPLGLDLRGLVLMNSHRFAEARDLARRALAKDPDDLMALGNLSDALLELGDFAAAKTAVQQMVDLRPGLPSYARAAHLRFLVGDNLGAKQLYRFAMDAGQSTKDTEPLAWVTVEAAKVFLLEANWAAAEAGFERALLTLPEYPAALVGLARVRLFQGRAAEAAQLAEQAFRQSQLAETAWLWGDALTQAGQAKQAEAAYATVRRLGEHGEGRVLAAFLAAQDLEPERALAAATLELKTRGEPYSHDAQAWASYRLGRYSEALAASQAATNLGTQDPLLLYHRGAILLAAGESEAGCEGLARARALGLHFPIKAVAELEGLLPRCGPKS